MTIITVKVVEIRAGITKGNGNKGGSSWFGETLCLKSEDFVIVLRRQSVGAEKALRILANPMGWCDGNRC